MPRVGFRHSEESLAKMRLAAKNRAPQSVETKQKRAAAHQGRKNSPETIQRMRESATGRIMSPEGRRKLSIGRIGRPVSIQAREKISAALSGRIKAPEHIAKIGDAQRGQIRGPLPFSTREKIRQALRLKAQTYHGRAHHSFGKTPSHVRRLEYNGRTYRSSYEVRFAQMLDRQRVRFEYEARTFDLGETTYTPDFFLPDCELWCEVKGWMTITAERKIDLFREKFITERLVVIPKHFFAQKLDIIQHGAQVDIERELDEARKQAT